MTSAVPVRASLTVLPRLDDLAADPSKVEGLPRSVLAALYADAARVEATLRAHLLAFGLSGEPAALNESDGDVLGLDEAASFLGMRPSTLYKKWRALSIGYRDVDGRVKFTRAALRRYIARRGG